MFYIYFRFCSDIIRRRQIDENATELDVGKNSSDYKFEVICNSADYTKKSTSHLLGLYYLIFCKVYLKEENT